MCCSLIPKPLRDLCVNAAMSADAQRSAAQINSQQGSGGAGSLLTLGADQKLGQTILRIALAAIGTFALMATNSSLLVGAFVGVFISPAAVIMSAGAYVAVIGVNLVINALATGILSKALLGIGGCLAGYVIMELYDVPSPCCPGSL